MQALQEKQGSLTIPAKKFTGFTIIRPEPNVRHIEFFPEALELPTPRQSALTILFAVILAAAYVAAWGAFIRQEFNIPLSPTTVPIKMPNRVPLKTPAASPSRPFVREATGVSLPNSATPEPQDLKARFIAPDTIELRWNSSATNVRYRIYSDQKPSMSNARLESETPLVAPYSIWSPEPGVHSVWLAVKSEELKGPQSGFSKPIKVEFAPI
jgi:hypothetical protein